MMHFASHYPTLLHNASTAGTGQRKVHMLSKHLLQLALLLRGHRVEHVDFPLLPEMLQSAY